MTAAPNYVDEARTRLAQASTLIAQALAALAEASGDQPEVPYMDARTVERVAKVGEVAHRHLAFIEEHGTMTMADSMDIRREMYGDKVRSTANLFGTKESGALFYRPAPYGTPTKNDQEVRLTEDGQQIAGLWRDLHQGK